METVLWQLNECVIAIIRQVIAQHFKIASWWFVDLSGSSLWRASLHVKCINSWERDRERGADTNQDLAISITHDLMRALCERKQRPVCWCTHPAVSTFLSTNILYLDFWLQARSTFTACHSSGYSTVSAPFWFYGTELRSGLFLWIVCCTRKPAQYWRSCFGKNWWT